MKMKLFQTISLSLSLALVAASQTGGTYTIERSVVATGGGTSSGGVYAVVGTAGQSMAGGRFQGSQFSMFSGFFTPPALAPTAASVSVSGRVFTPSGQGLANAMVLLVNMNGETRVARTGSFGYYSFEGVEAGQVYLLSVESKRFQFVPQTMMVLDELNDLNFTALT